MIYNASIKLSIRYSYLIAVPYGQGQVITRDTNIYYLYNREEQLATVKVRTRRIPTVRHVDERERERVRGGGAE